MSTAKLFNRSAFKMEEAEKSKCPRCKGHGGCFPQDDGGNCLLCKGHRWLWRSTVGGWIRPMYGTIGESEQLW